MSSLTPNRSHVLLTLGVLFTIGGITRFLPEGIAFAEQQPNAPAPATAAANPAAGASTQVQAPSQSLPDRRNTAPPGEICFSAETAAALQEDQWLFENGREELREKQLQLQTWETELTGRTAELRALQAALEERWQAIQSVSDADVQHLAQMYSVMKPDQAAQIFNQMDPGFAAGFLRLIQSDQAGLILANMDSQKAYVVSVRLASMNNDVRNAPPARLASN
ncbi:MotE family protein [Hyphomonas sp.]|uniref:MotE family protein n=1 Tax=Hyphomonas sp. TaxID=87 RepID=UPI00391BA709